MRALRAGLVISAAAMAPAWAHAEKNPYELKADKNNKGMVIVEIDDSPIANAPLAHPVSFNLEVTWFDAARKKPHIELHWVSSPNTAEFTEVSESGHRYLIGPIGEGEAMIVSYYVQSNWGVCYDAQTYHFAIKRGTYNFIGKYNPYTSQQAIQDAVTTGKMPRTVQSHGWIPPLTGQKLGDDLIPASELPDDKTAIEALLASKLGAPVSVVEPPLQTIDYNLAKNAWGGTTCAFWSSASDLKEAPAGSDAAPPANP
jgi:hypothetical protein